MNRISFILFFLIVLMLPNKLIAQNDLVGPATEIEILASQRIYSIYADRYKPDSTAISYLNSVKEPVHVVVLFGTWCHDSKKHIPRFIKVMRLIKNPAITAEYVAQDRSKSDPDGISKDLNLQYTPTLVIYLSDKEIGRIVETPTESIEKDFVGILKAGISHSQ